MIEWRTTDSPFFSLAKYCNTCGGGTLALGSNLEAITLKTSPEEGSGAAASNIRLVGNRDVGAEERGERKDQ